MKIKAGFVTNSSSTSFIIHNRSNKKLSLVNFVEENPQLIEKFVEYYDVDPNRYNQTALIKSAKENNEFFTPHKSKECVFGDEDGTLIGEVFDYQLRKAGSSKNFTWRFHKSLR